MEIQTKQRGFYGIGLHKASDNILGAQAGPAVVNVTNDPDRGLDRVSLPHVYIRGNNNYFASHLDYGKSVMKLITMS